MGRGRVGARGAWGKGRSLAFWRPPSPLGLEANAGYFRCLCGLVVWCIKAGAMEESRPVETPRPIAPPFPLTVSRRALGGFRLRASAPRTEPAAQGPKDSRESVGEHCLRDTLSFSLSHTEGRCARVFTSEFQVIVVRMLLEIWGGKSSEFGYKLPIVIL